MNEKTQYSSEDIIKILKSVFTIDTEPVYIKSSWKTNINKIIVNDIIKKERPAFIPLLIEDEDL